MSLSTYYKIEETFISTALLKVCAQFWHFCPKRAIQLYINTAVIKYFPFAEKKNAELALLVFSTVWKPDFDHGAKGLILHALISEIPDQKTEQHFSEFQYPDEFFKWQKMDGLDNQRELFPINLCLTAFYSYS